MKPVKPSPAPWSAHACQADHGETTVIVDALGYVVATINSPAWDDNATLEYPQDRANLALILDACNRHGAAIQPAGALDSAHCCGEPLRCKNAPCTWSDDCIKRLGATLDELHAGLKAVNRSHDVEHLIHQVLAIKATVQPPEFDHETN